MPVETATYISDLNAANPVTGDGLVEGDDHLRLLKATLRATFPAFTGALASTQTQIDNTVTNVAGGLIKFPNGSSSAPGIAFSANPGTGWWNTGTAVGLSILGGQVLGYSASIAQFFTNMQGFGTFTATGNITSTTGALIAAGGVFGSAMTISGAGSFAGALSVGGALTAGSMSTSGGISGGTVVSLGDATVGGTLSVAGTTNTHDIVATGNIGASGAGSFGALSATSATISGNVTVTGGSNSFTGNLSVGGTLGVTGAYTGGTGQLVPTGTILDFASGSIPAGYLNCDGSAVSRTTYAALFTLLGTYYGAGNGSTTFNLPDLSGRVTAGIDYFNRLAGVVGSAATLGATGGSDTVVLTAGQLASHSHTPHVTTTDTGHLHSLPNTFDITATVSVQGSSPNTTVIQAVNNTGPDQNTASATTGISVGVSIDPAGGNQAHSNVQPTFIIYKIIKT
jgi:microcystin-dependent protein